MPRGLQFLTGAQSGSGMPAACQQHDHLNAGSTHLHRVRCFFAPPPAAGTRLLPMAVVGAVLQQPPLAVLVQQALLMCELRGACGCNPSRVGSHGRHFQG